MPTFEVKLQIMSNYTGSDVFIENNELYQTIEINTIRTVSNISHLSATYYIRMNGIYRANRLM
jgi:hypothetical protein